MDDQPLKRAGLKITAPRMLILQILESHEARHLSAEDIYRILLDSDHDVGMATVYRVLTQFEAADLVIRHNFEGGHSVFELNSGHHHDHLVCIKCGAVMEFVDDVIEHQQQLVAEKFKFEITEHSFNIYGYCEPCAAKRKSD